MKNEGNKNVIEGKLMPFHDVNGWFVQEPVTLNDPGIRTGSHMFQWAIGKKVRVTIEVIE